VKRRTPVNGTRGIEELATPGAGRSGAGFVAGEVLDAGRRPGQWAKSTLMLQALAAMSASCKLYT